MESDECRLSRLAVEAIIRDFTDRRGLRQAWDSIDRDIRKEIKHTWYLKVLEIARPIVEAAKGE